MLMNRREKALEHGAFVLGWEMKTTQQITTKIISDGDAHPEENSRGYVIEGDGGGTLHRMVRKVTGG